MRRPFIVKPAVIAALLLLVPASQGGSGNDGLIFSHSLHVEVAEISCADCHPKAAESDTVSDNLLPPKETCADCHDVEDESSCGTCHGAGDSPGGYPAVESAGIFSHGKHAANAVVCAACHAGVEGSGSAAEDFLPEMKQCFECHVSKGLAVACRACHTEKENLRPSDHVPDWRHTHPRSAALAPESCDICHRERISCKKCHGGDNLTDGSPHALSYRFSHGPDARMQATDCNSCHRSQAFCSECHSAHGVKPLSHQLPNWNYGEHSREAERHLDQCIMCHPESEAAAACGKCHI